MSIGRPLRKYLEDDGMTKYPEVPLTEYIVTVDDGAMIKDYKMTGADVSLLLHEVELGNLEAEIRTIIPEILNFSSYEEVLEEWKDA